jgi:F0F1-type ATP synthase delta subunit
MNLATSYAKALFEVAKRDTTSAPEVFKNLRESLRRRGHEKLLPRIYSEFEKLELGEERLKEYKRSPLKRSGHGHSSSSIEN